MEPSLNDIYSHLSNEDKLSIQHLLNPKFVLKQQTEDEVLAMYKDKIRGKSEQIGEIWNRLFSVYTDVDGDDNEISDLYPVEQAFRCFVDSCLDHLLQNELHTNDGDLENGEDEDEDEEYEEEPQVKKVVMMPY